jgi:hypothetical protein
MKLLKVNLNIISLLLCKNDFKCRRKTTSEINIIFMNLFQKYNLGQLSLKFT